MKLGADIAIDTVNLVLEKDGDVKSVDQNTFIAADSTTLHPAPKIFKETCRINWQKTASDVHNFVRGLSPYPGSWTQLAPNDDAAGNPVELKVFATSVTARPCEDVAPGTIEADKKHLFVACADSWLEIKSLQLAGKKRMSAIDFLNGNRNITDFKLA